MDALKDGLPITALCIVFIAMAYTNIAIIGDFGRMVSFIPILAVIVVWILALLKTRGDADVQ